MNEKNKSESQEIFDNIEKKEVKKLYDSEEYKNASEIKKMEFRLALRMRNVLRMD